MYLYSLQIKWDSNKKKLTFSLLPGYRTVQTYIEYGLQGPAKENIPISPFETIHSSCTYQTNLTHSTRSNICSNNQTKFLCCHKYRVRSTHKPISSANQRYTRLKKYDEKPFRANGNYAKPPHNCAY
jgi:hypothetical protein